MVGTDPAVEFVVELLICLIDPVDGDDDETDEDADPVDEGDSR